MAKTKDEDVTAKEDLIKQLQQQLEAERLAKVEAETKLKKRNEWTYEVLWKAARAVHGGGTGKDIRNGLDELKKELGDQRVEEMEKKWRGVV